MPAPKNDGGIRHAHSVERRTLDLPDGETVAALLTRLELTGRRVAVELNLDIVPRSQHAETTLNDGRQRRSGPCHWRRLVASGFAAFRKNLTPTEDFP